MLLGMLRNGIEYPADRRLDPISHFHEAEGGGVDTIDGALVGMFSKDRPPIEEVDIQIAGGTSRVDEALLKPRSILGRSKLGRIVELTGVADFRNDEDR